MLPVSYVRTYWSFFDVVISGNGMVPGTGTTGTFKKVSIECQYSLDSLQYCYSTRKCAGNTVAVMESKNFLVLLHTYLYAPTNHKKIL